MSDVKYIGVKYVTPYLRLFPIWRHGPCYDAIDGYYIDDGWYADRYGARMTRARKKADADQA